MNDRQEVQISPFFRRLCGLMAATLLLPMLIAVPSAQATPGEITLSGHGWGHGRGLGQYGAYGYAKKGWTSAQILDHYYGGTHAASAPTDGPVDPNRVRVDLLFMAGVDTTVFLESGTLYLKKLSGEWISRLDSQAIRLKRTTSGYDIQTASNCRGNFVTRQSITDDEVIVDFESSAEGRAGLIEVCGPNRSVWYQGSVLATRTSKGQPRTVNIVPVEQYLRGVVPNESPAYWPQAALESQAVAARSYVLAGDTRFLPYADTCDTPRCQVYDGMYTTRKGAAHAAFHVGTDRAIAATANIVRMRSSKIVRTEFSSSTGGYTAGGTFPAVADEGDSVSANPNHRWTTEVSLSKLDKYGLGRATGVEIAKRNGLGAEGGRVLEVNYLFGTKTKTVSGNRMRLDFGLKSDWFSLGVFNEHGQVVSSDEDYVDHLFERFERRQPTDAEVVAYSDLTQKQGRQAAAHRLAVEGRLGSDAIEELYVRALGRGSDQLGKQYWLSHLRAGEPISHLGLYFYGSDEYWRNSGADVSGFLDSLYRDLLKRAPDESGKRYWAGLINSRQIDQVGVVFYFYRSVESRRQRAEYIHHSVLGDTLRSSVVNRDAERLLETDDLTLAAELAVTL